MASNSPNECSLCTEEYNEEERTPRGLPCAHSLCSECIDNLIKKNDKLCPYCRRGFQATSIKDIGVNTSLVDFMKIFKEMKLKAGHPKPTELHDLKEGTITSANKIIAECEQVQEQIDNAVKNNKELQNNALQAINSLLSEIATTVKEMTAKTAQTIKYITQENEILQEQKSEIEGKHSQMTNAVKKLNESDSFRIAGPLIDDVKDITNDAQNKLHIVKSLMSGDEETHQRIKKVAETNREKMQMHKKDLEALTKEIENVELMRNYQLMIGKKEAIPVTIEDLRNKTESVTGLMKQGKIYAVQRFESKLRVAKISICKENRICLHHLCEEPLPPNAHILQHSNVMKLVNPTSRLTFIELSDAQKRNLGRIYITVSPNGKRAQQFTLLCTAELGYTYTNSKIKCINNKGNNNENVGFGDYENLGGKGGKALVPDSWKEAGGNYKRPALAGTVQGRRPREGEAEASQFFIITKDNPDYTLDWCFGKVENGLGILTDAIAKQPNIRDVFISDTGIVLPL